MKFWKRSRGRCCTQNFPVLRIRSDSAIRAWRRRRVAVQIACNGLDGGHIYRLRRREHGDRRADGIANQVGAPDGCGREESVKHHIDRLHDFRREAPRRPVLDTVAAVKISLHGSSATGTKKYLREWRKRQIAPLTPPSGLRHNQNMEGKRARYGFTKTGNDHPVGRIMRSVTE